MRRSVVCMHARLVVTLDVSVATSWRPATHQRVAGPRHSPSLTSHSSPHFPLSVLASAANSWPKVVSCAHAYVFFSRQSIFLVGAGASQQIRKGTAV